MLLSFHVIFWSLFFGVNCLVLATLALRGRRYNFGFAYYFLVILFLYIAVRFLAKIMLELDMLGLVL